MNAVAAEARDQVDLGLELHAAVRHLRHELDGADEHSVVAGPAQLLAGAVHDDLPLVLLVAQQAEGRDELVEGHARVAAAHAVLGEHPPPRLVVGGYPPRDVHLLEHRHESVVLPARARRAAGHRALRERHALEQQVQPGREAGEVEAAVLGGTAVGERAPVCRGAAAERETVALLLERVREKVVGLLAQQPELGGGVALESAALRQRQAEAPRGAARSHERRIARGEERLLELGVRGELAPHGVGRKGGGVLAPPGLGVALDLVPQPLGDVGVVAFGQDAVGKVLVPEAQRLPMVEALQARGKRAAQAVKERRGRAHREARERPVRVALAEEHGRGRRGGLSLRALRELALLGRAGLLPPELPGLELGAPERLRARRLRAAAPAAHTLRHERGRGCPQAREERGHGRRRHGRLGGQPAVDEGPLRSHGVGVGQSGADGVVRGERHADEQQHRERQAGARREGSRRAVELGRERELQEERHRRGERGRLRGVAPRRRGQGGVVGDAPGAAVGAARHAPVVAAPCLRPRWPSGRRVGRHRGVRPRRRGCGLLLLLGDGQKGEACRGSERRRRGGRRRGAAGAARPSGRRPRRGERCGLRRGERRWPRRGQRRGRGRRSGRGGRGAAARGRRRWRRVARRAGERDGAGRRFGCGKRHRGAARAGRRHPCSAVPRLDSEGRGALLRVLQISRAGALLEAAGRPGVGPGILPTFHISRAGALLEAAGRLGVGPSVLPTSHDCWVGAVSCARLASFAAVHLHPHVVSTLVGSASLVAPPRLPTMPMSAAALTTPG